jgi:hypothetical protein
VTLAVAAFLVLLPAATFAQEGQIAGTVRDASGGVIPGVLVEVTSPALIEKVRSTTSDASGQYRITNLPVGTYSVVFTLEGFSKQQRDNVELTTGFTAAINATMSVGQLAETVTVVSETPTVDVQSARQVAAFTGETIRELPTPRTLRSLLTLTPGLTQTGLGADCVGNVGVWCNNNIYNLSAHAAPNDTEAQGQGRVMIDGTIINTGGGAGIMGMTGGYAPDVANSQEVNIQLSGALGESETGGAAINIVPRTGGNRFSGNWYTTYTTKSWFDKNNDTHSEVTQVTVLNEDYTISGAFGGPIKRDHLWFFSAGQHWQKDARNSQNLDIWDNKNRGLWGMNYQPDRTTDPLNLINKTASINVRVTYQATQKDKINFFWDEGFTCQDPCDGAVAAWAPRDGNWSGQVHPARLRQVSWTNPLTNKILLEAGLAVNTQLYDFSYMRYMPGVQSIPRVVEFGPTVGADEVSPVVNSTNFALFGVQSGNLNNGPNSIAEWRQLDDYRPRASLSYVTGTHNAKFGYDGGYFSQQRHNAANDLRLSYQYNTPGLVFGQYTGSCTPGAWSQAIAATWCGNTSRYFPGDPLNLAMRPVPTQFTINTGVADIWNNVNYSALYVQDQWTLKRLTLNGAIRFDHATSSYGETCIGPDPSAWIPVQVGGTYAGQQQYCTPPSDGVNYNNITPRWGVVWDMFGNGRTSFKYTMGKYLAGAGVNGIYADANPAQRTVNNYTRTWTDVDGDRIVDCDPLNTAAQNNSATGGDVCGGPGSVFGQDATRYGRDPLSLDAAGTPLGLATTQCGRQEEGIPVRVQQYCDVYGESLIEGWDRRRSEWQLGLGIQHEILPRLSAEFTYNRRDYANLTVTDQLGNGCDRYNGTGAAADLQTCLDNNLNYTNPNYDFFHVNVPVDPRLPDGGGYAVRGFTNPKLGFSTNGLSSAVTFMEELEYTSHFFDTNFVWRGPRGIRVNGGTSTGRAYRNTCYTETDAPNVKARDGNNPACDAYQPWLTNVRGTATYTIPYIDVLVSSVFQYRPSESRNVNLTFSKDQVLWESGSASRATAPCTGFGAPVGQTGCFVAQGFNPTATTYTLNVVDPYDLRTEGYMIFDLKFAKNFRFANKRVNVGVDVYNLLNNDAIRTYQDTYPATQAGVPFGTPLTLLSPRFVRAQVQFDF